MHGRFNYRTKCLPHEETPQLPSEAWLAQIGSHSDNHTLQASGIGELVDVSRIGEDEYHVHVLPVVRHRQKKRFFVHVLSAWRGEWRCINEWRVRLHDSVIAVQCIAGRRSKETFQHRFASGVIAADHCVTRPNESIHISALVSDNIDNADSRE